MPRKKVTSATVDLRYVGSGSAQYWNAGWHPVKPGSVVTFKAEGHEKRLADGLWELVTESLEDITAPAVESVAAPKVDKESE